MRRQSYTALEAAAREKYHKAMQATREAYQRDLAAGKTEEIASLAYCLAAEKAMQAYRDVAFRIRMAS